MLVQMETSIVEDFSALAEGQIYDLPDARAKRLIGLGKAKAIGLPSSRSAAKTGAVAKAQ